jgi:hypothetical protein
VIAAGGDCGKGVMTGDTMGRVVEAVYKDGADSTATLYGELSIRLPSSVLGRVGRKERNGRFEEQRVLRSCAIRR